MSEVVFKQSYRSRNLQGTPGLNVRHLHYIATRPGAVFNPGCGFGLWGKLPGDDSIRIQNDLVHAEQMVKERSEERTIYRAIISVGKDTAEEKGMYHRENWEQLVNDQIDVIAKEMDIRPENFCWCASMHYTKSHPHVHILYWDDGSDPRPEGIGKNSFEKKAEHIRAAFSRELFHEEILEQQQLQRNQQKEIRQLLRSLCQEANPEKAVNVQRLYLDGTLDQLTEKMEQLIRDIPPKGSLRYSYLPPDYKAQVDEMVKACLQIPELRAELEAYEKATNEIARLYSNGEKAAQHNREKAHEKLHRELANEVMNGIRAIQSQIRTAATGEAGQYDALIEKAAKAACGLASYGALQQLLPKHRIPVSCMGKQIPGYHEQLNTVVKELMADARFRLKFEGAVLARSGIDLALCPDAQRVQGSQESRHRLFGKELEDRQWDDYKQSYRTANKELCHAVTAQLRRDAGWERDAIHTESLMMVCNMMHLLGQIAGQQRGRASWKRLYSKDKSKAAKKDLNARKPNNDWEQDFDY